MWIEKINHVREKTKGAKRAKTTFLLLKKVKICLKRFLKCKAQGRHYNRQTGK